MTPDERFLLEMMKISWFHATDAPEICPDTTWAPILGQSRGSWWASHGWERRPGPGLRLHGWFSFRAEANSCDEEMKRKNLQNQHLLTKTRLFILNIIGCLYYCLMLLVVSLVCEELLRVRQKTTNMPFILALSFSYFTMNISGSISSVSVCCCKEAKEADRKGCTLIFLGWNIYLEVKQVSRG